MFLDPAKQHDDLRLWRRAIRQRWPISDDFKQVAINRLQAIVAGQDDELALKAIAETRQMISQNQKDEHKVVDVGVATRHDQLSEIATDLGITVGALTHADRAGESSGSGVDGVLQNEAE